MAGNTRGKGRATPQASSSRRTVLEDFEDTETQTPDQQTEGESPTMRDQLAPGTPAPSSMDPQQFQALMMQAMTNFSTGLGTLGVTLANLGTQGGPLRAKDDRPPAYAVSKLKFDASFQDREDWLQAVEQGNATRQDRPQWLQVQWASTWMEPETQQQWRAYQKQLHEGDFEQITWQEFEDYVSSDCLGSKSGEVQAHKDWLVCNQRGRSPQEFYREWAALVRRLPGMEINSTFMARDYWIKLDRFYHNRYAEAVPNVTSAKDCAEWCERIWLARLYTRNGNDRDAHRKRLGSPTNLGEARKLPRTTEDAYSGLRHDKARIQRRELRDLPTRNPFTSGRPATQTPPATGSNTQAPLRNREPITCYNCGKQGHVQRQCTLPRAEARPGPGARIQNIGIEDDSDHGSRYLAPSDSEDDSENERR
ncbi:hypothetical protein B0T26DRAFT_674293 [Lasiosphaeria miniovina]|uniref:CCHC-type domain-containing protein n=1 Tax=Lasiosphaeria miniovina TaxID=1954250 RepID=A0AA40AVA1_9PEZI|nr:uncharacterized protein B0T26DRAFT_674293 [Lasiosphaeria miniovina]KAK0722609.1 hypothetical protein B0T26DRAFT_674293 [Lasiosphaeria miniovina]